MPQTFDMYDHGRDHTVFLADEVQYNLLHRICESNPAVCLKASDRTMIFAQSEGHNGWLWMASELADDRKHSLMQELADFLGGTALPGVSGDPETVERFAQLYSRARGLRYAPAMTMESYSCPNVKKPHEVKGALHPASKHDVENVATFLAGFAERAYGATVEPASQRPAAEGAIATGNLYLWLVDGGPVAMANIAHRSPRHGRINMVYTSPDFRRKGFASAIVAELCEILVSEGLEPMLYADLNNPAANKAYQNIGFVERGKVADIKFKEL